MTATTDGMSSLTRVRSPHNASPPCKSPGPVSFELGSAVAICQAINAPPMTLAIQPRSLSEWAQSADPTKSAPAVMPHNAPDIAHDIPVPGKRRPANCPATAPAPPAANIAERSR